MTHKHYEEWPSDEGYSANQEPGDDATPTCSRCGAADLEWVDIGMGRWRLYDGKKMHVCKASPDGFEDLTK